MWAGNNIAVAFGLGLTGAHRTGKTTIAERLAQELECPFISSSASQVAAEMGITKFEGMLPSDRRAYQERVLETFTKRYESESASGVFVSDRTPLDFAAYVLTEWNPALNDPEHDEWVADYLLRCKKATSRFFFQVAVVQPGIPFVAAKGKAAAGNAYRECLNTVSIGLVSDPEVSAHCVILPRAMTDNETRVEALFGLYTERFNAYAEELVEAYGKPA